MRKALSHLAISKIHMLAMILLEYLSCPGSHRCYQPGPSLPCLNLFQLRADIRTSSPIVPSSPAHSSQLWLPGQRNLLDFCQSTAASSNASLIAVGLTVRAGNSSCKSYLFTTPKFNRARRCSVWPVRFTFCPSVLNPLVLCSHMLTNKHPPRSPNPPQ